MKTKLKKVGVILGLSLICIIAISSNKSEAGGGGKNCRDTSLPCPTLDLGNCQCESGAQVE